MQYAEWMASELMGRAWSNPAIMWPKVCLVYFMKWTWAVVTNAVNYRISLALA